MGFPSIFSFFVVSHLVIVHSTRQDDMDKYQHGCPESFNCGKLGLIKFPFSNDTYPRCGLCTVNCSEPVPIIYLGWTHQPYEVKEFLNDEAVNVSDKYLRKLISSNSCDIFSKSLFPYPTPSISYTISPNLSSLFKCPTNGGSKPQLQTEVYSFSNCTGYTVYYTDPNQHTQIPANLSPDCEVIKLPMLPSIRSINLSDLFSLLAYEFTIGLHVSKECYECRHNGGQCRGLGEFHCIKDEVKFKHLKYRNYVSSVVLSINTSPDPSSKPDLEGGSVYFGVPVFSYTELEEATNNFDPSKELGDGGFGTVYYGKLQDGREVAVKRLYEHNYKRVTQFMNEIEILTRLRHRNLVTLYGCTSRLSRELLLVYEYIPNGTVADHIHGDRAKDRPLVWSIRMSIAIETASALTYLHASDIIHRDVKTNNILLDNNFCVKVADFGLSRLFPNDVTHVSTAPQGTPGYVDPEYHQCYQLTDKSDVYSFGVVLIELISSMTAVDISRHRHEINLANLAINRIRHRAFNELIDPSLGFESDSSIERMTTMFMNEIEILTRLHHHNLVSLYGCTSRLSRKLLLIYEYIPNGTVADHIHGDRAKDGPLVWPIRMSIAIETASALAYLHAFDIIHHDVKTNNILLDNNFCVKVADFGLSRLVPNNVTHVSTAPQGTPGYLGCDNVDPQYHQYFQLTDKSDVYSLGVVLIELVSSTPAINLADLAINRIQNRAFHELIDPSLGFERDSLIKKTTTMVAEVAFRCLQLEKEMRPTMDEVLKALKEIQESKDKNNREVIDNVEVSTSTRPPPLPEGNDIVLLKNSKETPSPDSVTERWVSCSSTFISCG
ncbi:hypothetical protein CsSME_00022448 [Camellia sinensis var. sinensis]